MPELPEVETIRRGLVDEVVGRRIDEVLARQCRVFQTKIALLEGLAGQVIRSLWRRGKYLIFDLDRCSFVVHLGMTGQLTLRDPRQMDSDGFLRHPTTGLQRTRQHAPDRHTHLQVALEDGNWMLYRDIRKFGRIYVFENEGAGLEKLLSRLGLEPLSEEYRLPDFLDRMSNRKLRVKSLLLDQRFVAGVGNIYADEALFEARIRPSRRVHGLRRYEKERLFASVRNVLERGLDFGGTSLRDYVNSDGELGSNQEELRVYGRAGLPCLVCGNAISKTVISQRGTHFCAHCQPSRPWKGP